MSSPPSAISAVVELLLDRFLSASTATDCLDSLDRLQVECRRRRTTASSSPSSQRGGGGDPKAKRPSQRDDQASEERWRAEEEEKEEEVRHATAVDTLLRNTSALHALCGLVSSSTLPPPPSRNVARGNAPSYVGRMEVEGGDVAACELLSVVLQPPPAANIGISPSTGARAGGGTTTEELQRRQRQRRRAEHISKTLLHFHDAVDADGAVDAVHALTPSLLDCLCASSSSSSSSSSAIDSPAPTSVYARVLSLQILQSLLSSSPGTLREQLMMAPDGINRLVDLLGHGPSIGVGVEYGDGGGGASNSIPEEVRNESILFLTSLASSSSMLARLITFSEGYDRSLKIALESSSSSSSPTASMGSGLSSGSTVAMDCLELCLALAHGDEVARELFLGGGDGRGNLDRLTRLVDLRGAERFRDKEKNEWWEKELVDKRKKKNNKETVKSDIVAIEGSDGTSQSMDHIAHRGNKRGKKLKDDDLDDILRGASSTTPAPNKSNAVEQSKQTPQQKDIIVEPESQPIPYLTPNEAKIVDSVFSLILVLLRDGNENTSSTATSRSKRRGRAKTIMSHDLARYIVDCALYTLPPPGVDYVSGVPPPALQQKAMLTMGVLGSLGDTVVSEEEAARARKKMESDEDHATSATAVALRKTEMEEEFKIQTKLLFETMPIYLRGWVTAIDRLMYLCCTGAYAPKFNSDNDDDCFYDDDERPEIVASLLSTYAISTFRSCLPPETASRMVLHALAPPPPDETDEMGAPLEPPVVTRLVTTLVDNLRFLQTKQHQLNAKIEGASSDMIDVYRATIGASGSAGALGVFLTRGEGDATREMLLRLSPPLPRDGPLQLEQPSGNMIDFILQHIATYDPNDSSNIRLHASLAYVIIVLLRLLSEWVIGMPRAVMAVLSSPSSVSVGVLVRSKKVGDDCSEAVSALCGLLLGLCLEFMLDLDDVAGRSTSANEVPDMVNIAWTKETIMNMVQSMGVGKYLSMIDEWKKRPLPLPYCKGKERSIMEQRAFASWYSNNVNLVRRRVVMALAGSRGDDSDESDAEGSRNIVFKGKNSSSVRSLRKMMSNQAQEIENLQMKLEDASVTITSQSNQIKELKRVTELATAAETIDMVSEYTEKMAELEKIKSELKKEAENRIRLQEESMAAKDCEISKVREELLECQTALDEIRLDNATLREEMAGLSSAYNMLEVQYHQTNSGNNLKITPTEMTASGEDAAEDGGAKNHSPGEAAAEIFGRSNSVEVKFLQDENARLREEGRVANEWMSMAVSKMEEMCSENESLAQSLDKALANLASIGSNETDSLSIQHHMEVQKVREESDAKLKAKDDEITKQQALVLQLENQIEDINLSIKNNDKTPSPQFEELQQVVARQELELESLRIANREAQDWMASAVTHVDKLTKEIQEKDDQLEKIGKAQQLSEDTSNDFKIKITELENTLKNVSSELSESQKYHEIIIRENGALLTENAALLKSISDSTVQDLSDKEEIKAELDQVKLEKVSLEASLSQFQSWTETAQIQLAEVKAKLKEAISERDDLMTRLKSYASGGDESISQDDNQLIESLRNELDEKNMQLERMQDQLIEDADEHEAIMDKLREDFDVEKQRAEDLIRDNSRLSTTVEKLSLEKEQLSGKLSAKEEENDDLRTRLESYASGGGESNSQDDNQLLESLRNELDEKNMQLERMQDQLIEDADEYEAKMDKLREDFDVEKQRAEDLIRDNSRLSTTVEKLSLEKEQLSGKLSAKQEENDDLRTRLESYASGGGESNSQDDHQLLESLRNELDEKNMQLERMQDQLIEDADEYEAKMDKLREDFDVEKQRAEDLIRDNSRLSTTVEKLSLEKEQLSGKLSAKQEENDDLRTRLESYASGGGESNSQDDNQLLESLRNELDEKNMQLERMQDQLIEDADEYEAKMDKLREDFDVEKQRAEDLIRDNSRLSTAVEKLSLEKEQLSGKLAESQVLLDSIIGENDAKQFEQAQLRISDLEAALFEAESRVHNLMALEEQITYVTAERDEIQSQLNRIADEYENNQVLKQENNSLQKQLSDLEREITEKNNAKLILQNEFDEFKTTMEESVQVWKKRIQSLELNVTSLEHQLEQQENEAAEAIAQWENRCSSLEEATSAETAQQWEERIQLLEANVTSLENQLEQQEKEAAEAIALWENRCSTLEESGGLIIQQWEERVQSLESDVTSLEHQLEQQLKVSAEAMTQLEATCSAQSENDNIVIRQFEESVVSLKADVTSLENQLHQKENEALESYAKFLEAEKSLATKKDELDTISQKMVALESTVEMMTSQIGFLSNQIEEKSTEIGCMQLQIQNKDVSLANSDKQLSELANELQETQQRSELVVKQWQERSEQLEANIAEFEVTITEMKIRSDEAVQMWQERAENQDKEAAEAITQWEARCDDLKEMLSALRDENAKLLQESKEAIKEKEDSQVVVFELKEELRHTNEQLRSFATDQFTKKASEIATQALRKQMEEIRSRYSADQEALLSEIEARRSAEEDVERLKSDLALLAQATEYDDNVDLHVRMVAKKISAENVKAERKEMEQLRSALERLREELGSCRWNEKQSVEITANARLQLSILEQEITAAKSDLELMKQALEDLETSKINMSVSFEYRIEVLENERLWTERKHEEEMHRVKAELAASNEERDNMAHKLELSEKANAALVFSTAHNGPGGEESESEVIKLQLERAHLLAKISEMGANLERRVREAVAAQVSSFEAELIVEKQYRHSAEASLTEALAELEKAGFASNTSSREDSSDSNQLTQSLKESLDDLRRTNDELLNKNNVLQNKLDSIGKEKQSTIKDLTEKLNKAQEDLRSHERESRFEAALAAEINNLRASCHTASNGNPKHSQALVLQGRDQNMPSCALFDDEKKSIDLNSAYVIEMYDYVCELKNSITEERQMYKDLLAEHEDLLALLGQTGLMGYSSQ
ncbi:hypothetical protein ACHAXA_005943 [Cyclostephanos tholiformis]|uniref:Vesicle tethering protein Uso1/P115-like head domain-containing protein n=1 Tax=Cyclostephanos tholiformis TaxID=382380 RepID=A0ABD3SEQ6_9STRA